MFSFLTNLFRSDEAPAATPAKKTTQLGVEQFEDRNMPSSFTLGQDGTLAIRIDEANRGLTVTQKNGVVSVSGASHGWYDWAVHKIYVQGGPGTCSIDLSGVKTIPSEVHGGSGNNYIYGTQTADRIWGGNGTNIIFGDGGNDELHGTGTTNRLIAGAGNSKLVADAGLNFMDGAENRGGHAQYWYGTNATYYYAEMYAPGGTGFRADHVKQGYTCNSCAFLSVLQGMAQAGVNFNNYIRFAGVNSSGQGVYDVSLYNGQRWVSVRVTFDGSTNTSDNLPTVNLASWAIIMERAWLQYHGNRGGTEYEVMVALGRRPSFTTTINGNTFNAMSYALSHGSVVTAGTFNTVSSSNYLEEKHAYTVVAVGYNNGQAVVKLRNPWGFNTVNGKRSGAEILITWNDFVRNFQEVTIG